MNFTKKIIIKILLKIGVYNLIKPYIKFYNRGLINMENSLNKIPKFDIIIDVGAGISTDALYQHSKDAFIYAFEPNPNLLKILKNKLSNRNHKIFEFGLSNQKSEQLLKLNNTGSSLHSWSKLTNIHNKKFKKQKIKLEKLEDIIDENLLKGKEVILKIDTEGHELKILEGSKKLLSSINYLLIETSILKRFEDSYEMLDVLKFLDNNGFKIGIFAELGTWNKMYRYADILFVKKNNYEKLINSISNSGI